MNREDFLEKLDDFDFDSFGKDNRFDNSDVYDVVKFLSNKIYEDLEDKTCKWQINDEYEDGLIYYTGCKMDWYLTNDSTLKNNSMNFCPKCGDKIEEDIKESN